MKEQQLDLFDFLDIEELSIECPAPKPKGRGRPPLTVKNPLDSVSPDVYMNNEGRPQVWLDDCLMGAIRAVGERDNRATSKNNYVSLYKTFKVLCLMPGNLTPERISRGLGLSHVSAWRIVKVIEFACFSIERSLKNPRRIKDYCTTPLPQFQYPRGL